VRGRHTLTDDPEAADVILFVEADPGSPFYERVVEHPLARRYPEKSFLYTRTDRPVAAMQGIYPGIPRGAYNPQWVRSGFYLVAIGWEEPTPLPPDPLLFSFIGAVGNHPVRERMLALNGGEGVIEDTSALWPYSALPPEERARMEAHYADVGRRSRFILAPRGRGVASIRLFEAMRMGRAPVILADDWVEPEGPDWQRFSVRVAERDVEQLPQILQARAPEAEAMGRRAREAWEAYFSEQTAFDTFVEWCLAIQRDRRLPFPILRRVAYVQSLRLIHAKRAVRRVLSRYGLMRPTGVPRTTSITRRPPMASSTVLSPPFASLPAEMSGPRRALFHAKWAVRRQAVPPLAALYDRVSSPPARRLHVYGVGAPKSGTHSVANLFAPAYRSEHEPHSALTIVHLLRLFEGRYSEAAVERLLRARDRWMGLDVEAAHYMHHVVGELVRVFPEARFVLTIRDPYTWLTSAVNQSIHNYRNPHPARAVWLALSDYRYGRYGFTYSPEEAALRAHKGVYPIGSYLDYWTAHN
ncbi:MAG TPA: exostosin family protein, partial [Anaeromyxobacteraceae bacterium]|nr:exostosin family protein [Anaeromyxobacteraceae bacterium]